MNTHPKRNRDPSEFRSSHSSRTHGRSQPSGKACHSVQRLSVNESLSLGHEHSSVQSSNYSAPLVIVPVSSHFDNGHKPSQLCNATSSDQISPYSHEFDLLNRNMKRLGVNNSPDAEIRYFTTSHTSTNRPQTQYPRPHHPFNPAPPPEIVSQAPADAPKPVPSPGSSQFSTPSQSPDPSVASSLGSPRIGSPQSPFERVKPGSRRGKRI
ncbi:hypothetical protein P9112_013991 [Eukaryota sp. TZLM1-RC]